MLESLKEFTTSTFNTAMNRVKNPAFGAFAISWCAFNWKQILYLFFADNGIYYKIEYISQNSSWWNVIILPAFSSLVLCVGLPWVNNAITKWQSKPLDNADSIENFKQARMIQRSTRLQRLKAKHDVTYDKVKTGAEKDIQSMKEQITESQVRMGELTKERDDLSKQLSELQIKYQDYAKKIITTEAKLEKALNENKSITADNNDLKLMNEYYKSILDGNVHLSDEEVSEIISNEKEAIKERVSRWSKNIKQTD
ncbi:TPA: hypothetical protein MJE31_00170 [Klebsiella pneumoniae]|uniref:hypothetical protein n=1 Tax=Klebsiella pneumoniae complex TaxID=3390273 RepID=UPI0007D0C7BC|nr:MULTISPECIES: hypothetical protein [Klebsiella]HDT1003656.1 hypothetical protein [Klebsiella pneumoniae subsp. pneumoniae]EKZ6827004.1 hypothetical protein [Klebsiella pneumoniae]ELC0794944.1 hypothetical protein [Klebsiella pneumoniae]ELH4121315.1 hypothetical protein [Klebsiella pneumoniae]WAU42260.1 hypothetical protein NOZ09_001263 [Klebsiella pneumoniae]